MSEFKNSLIRGKGKGIGESEIIFIEYCDILDTGLRHIIYFILFDTYNNLKSYMSPSLTGTSFVFSQHARAEENITDGLSTTLTSTRPLNNFELIRLTK